MQSRTVIEFATLRKKIQYQLPECDVELFLINLRNTKQTKCIVVDGVVMFPGLFDTTTVTKMAAIAKKLITPDAKHET
jgi:hypothetical protein